MSETYHVDVAPDAYDPIQLRLIDAYGGTGPGQYDMTQLGQGVDYMAVGPIVARRAPEPVPASAGQLAVNVYFGDEGIHLATDDHFRGVRWVGTAGNPRPNKLSTAVSKLRRVGTAALLGDPELVIGRREIERWIDDIDASSSDPTLMASALRTWWLHNLRIATRELIVTDMEGGGWTARANPNMTFTESSVPLVEGYGRKATRIAALSNGPQPGIIEQDA